MKQVLIGIGIMAMVVMMNSSLVSADIIAPHIHIVTRCIKFENIAEFPGIVVIEYFKGRGARSYDSKWGGGLYTVSQDSCVTQGDRHGRFYFLWAPKPWFDSVGIDHLPIQDFIKVLSKKTTSDSAGNSPLHLLSTDISPINKVVPDSNNLRFEELLYRLYKDKTGISVYLAKIISHFQDSTSTTETFTRDKQPVGANGK